MENLPLDEDLSRSTLTVNPTSIAPANRRQTHLTASLAYFYREFSGFAVIAPSSTGNARQIQKIQPRPI
ncbi:MAG: hypothetical protein KME17_14540 [Cyanosarcina radialis HA8281-LM2]|nr:hypothetical protein [Cyanosarcina radialis HA8281-LM2]